MIFSPLGEPVAQNSWGSSQPSMLEVCISKDPSAAGQMHCRFAVSLSFHFLWQRSSQAAWERSRRTGCWPRVGPAPLCISKQIRRHFEQALTAVRCLSQRLRWNGRWAPWIVNADPNGALSNSCSVSSLGEHHLLHKGKRQSLKGSPEVITDKLERWEIQVCSFFRSRLFHT